MSEPLDRNDPQIKALIKLKKNPILAHHTIFRHRHPNLTPLFHRDMIKSWYSKAPHVLWLVFRGGGKSTIAEEGVTIDSGFRQFKNGLIVGSTLDRACERLTAIKTEIATNEYLEEVFGNLKGSVWGSEEVVFSNGVRILAMGRGQAIRGTKYNDTRPDFVFIDDLEGEEDVANPEARRKTKRWFLKELLPALDPSYRLRMAATPLDRESLPMELKADPTFETHVYPIKYLDEEGKWQPTWPDRFPSATIDKIEQMYYQQGETVSFNMEYMCQADDQKDKIFRAEMFRIEPQVRTWQAVYTMHDPARTVKTTSATTGYAAWSWIANRLVVWDGWARKLLPDEIVNSLFEANEQFKPAFMGIEEDGLNEFLMQPIRQEQLKRQVLLPVMPMRAPPGKNAFIRGLQPFFQNREVIFAKDLPDARAQFLTFPSGRIDLPNALAYALKLRPGASIYDGFSAKNIGSSLRPVSDRKVYLCMNATRSLVSAVLVQMVDGALRIFADWVREGDPGMISAVIVSEAFLEARGRMEVCAPPNQFETYTNFGMIQAVRRVPCEIRKGVKPELARDLVQDLLERDKRGSPALVADERARWTLNGLAGAYARGVDARGVLTGMAEETIYRTLMEGLESFVGLTRLSLRDDEETNLRYDTTKDGRSFISARR